jgi:putative DNA primase/helicase
MVTQRCAEHQIEVSDMTSTETNNPMFYENRKFLPNEFAKHLITKAGEHFATPRDTEVIHRYQNGIYRPDGVPHIKETIEKAVDGKDITGRSVSEVLGHIQRRTYIDRDEFDENPDEITVKNGVLNTKTFEFVPHDPSRRFLLRIPVKYDPDADCPKFKAFLSEILDHVDERNTIEELFGYCLIKNYSIQKWFMFLGNGANGKGTLLSTLRTFLGAENIAAVELQEFEKPFSIAELYGRLANIVGDLSAKELYHSGRLKSLTGGDLLLAEKKFQNPFNFINYAKLIYSANELPRTFDGTLAFWRRVMLINFNKTFIGDKDVKDLWKEFTTEEELSGILNMAVEGIQRLAVNGGFSKSNSVEEVEEFYIRNSDPVTAFFMDCVETTNDMNDFISLQALHTAFVEYCKRYRFVDLSQRKFNAAIRNNFRLRESREKNEETGKQERVWSGIFLSFTKDDVIPSSSFDSMTEMTSNNLEGGKKCLYNTDCQTGHSGFSVTPMDSGKIMAYIQDKISEYGNAENHTYNVIEALLEKNGVPADEAEHCINLHKEGQRVHIPQKRV